jgi:WD40 repeat protein
MFVTSNAELFEISSITGQSLHHYLHQDGSNNTIETYAVLEGHGGDELWGLAANPVKDEYCSVGDDAMLRFWDINSHCCKKSVPLEMPARSCCYSPDGKFVVIGFGSPRKVGDINAVHISTSIIHSIKY